MIFVSTAAAGGKNLKVMPRCRPKAILSGVHPVS
jgi:hypothetical protein